MPSSFPALNDALKGALAAILVAAPALFGAAVLIGIARAFSGPAYSALAPNLVPKESLPTAIAISSNCAARLGLLPCSVYDGSH